MKRVLILEDEPFIAMDLAFAFQDEGIATVSAANCEQALEALQKEKIDGAVLDVNLGRGETCEAVATELRQRAIPFILNTGDLDRVGEMLRGMNAKIISKPSAADQVVRELMAEAA
ncbi:MAG: response regulator [Pseudomonadota bacterium]|nr:response regulator [Pseudomonadota bacterium]